MKDKMKHLKRCIMMGALLWVLCMAITPVKAYIQRDGIIIETTTMRQIADDASKKVAKLAAGQKVKVNNEVTNNSGEVWYQIYVKDGVVGYVSADKIDVEDIKQTTPSEEQTQVVTITERIGTVTAQTAIRVREKSSTESAQIASMVTNDTFLVLKDETASDGYVWYEIELNDYGTIIHGYVRSDLVSVREVVREEYEQIENESMSERPTAQQTTKDDMSEDGIPYSIISQESVTGKTKWYLVDKQNGDTTEIEFLLSGGMATLQEKINVGIYKCLILAAVCVAIHFYVRWKEALRETTKSHRSKE